MSAINPHYILHGKPSKYKDESDIVCGVARGEITAKQGALMMGVTEKDVREFVKIRELGYGKLRKKKRKKIKIKR